MTREPEELAPIKNFFPRNHEWLCYVLGIDGVEVRTIDVPVPGSILSIIISYYGRMHCCMTFLALDAKHDEDESFSLYKNLNLLADIGVITKHDIPDVIVRDYNKKVWSIMKKIQKQSKA